MSNKNTEPSKIQENDIPSSSSDEGEMECSYCGQEPCDWIKYGDMVLEQVDNVYKVDNDNNVIDKDNKIVPYNIVCKNLYRFFTYVKHGHLGKGKIIQLPKCVLGGIQDVFLDEKKKEYGL